MHPRQAIRDAITACLVGNTVARENVCPNRRVSWQSAQVPGIAVYFSEGETSEQGTVDGDLDREATFEIVGVVMLTDDVDNQLDDLSLEIEKAMNADATLAGTATDSTLTATKQEYWDESGRLLGVTRLTYTITYSTPAVYEE